MKDHLQSMPQSKMAERGSSAVHPELETKLLEWKMQLVYYTWLS